METSDIEIARMQSFEGLKASMREYVVNMLASTNDTEGLTYATYGFIARLVTQSVLGMDLPEDNQATIMREMMMILEDEMIKKVAAIDLDRYEDTGGVIH